MSRHARLITMLLVVALPIVPHDPAMSTGTIQAQTTPARAVRERAGATSFKFDFGSGEAAPGYVRVLPSTAYTAQRGYGFVDAPGLMAIDRGGRDRARGDFITSDKPFLFAIDVPEGNYKVTVTLGDRQGESVTTVRAESRRLMLERVRTAPGEFATRTFTVNVRNSRINSNEKVSLKPRELNHLNWDDQLTLEFNDVRPCVAAVEITRADDLVTVYLAGDSTVTDQAGEPWAAWGQMLPRFFKSEVVIANQAESGESLRSFLGEKRLAKILSTIKPGDYLFIQFAHNDQKHSGTLDERIRGYKQHLKLYIDEARKRGATPVLVTSMHRRRFSADGEIVNSLEDYPEAMRQTARAEGVALIDLNRMSESFYEALGPEKSKRAFVHYPAGTFPGQTTELKDDTHFNSYGAYQLARCVLEGIKANKLPIAKHIAGDVRAFDPSRPEPVESWSLPASPASSSIKPAGS